MNFIKFHLFINYFQIIFLSVSFLARSETLEDDASEDYSSLGPSNFHHYDPNDMISKPLLKIVPPDNDLNSMDLNAKSSDCKYELSKLSFCEKKLTELQNDVTILETKIEAEKQSSTALLKKLDDAQILDVSSFYNRLLRRLSSLLRLEEPDLRSSDDHHTIRWLTFDVSQVEASIFQRHFQGEDVYHEIDRFFHEHVQEERRNESMSWSSVANRVLIFAAPLARYEIWVKMLWGLLAVVGLWGFWLFVRDTHRELRWFRVVVMMLMICFLISCAVHWNHMVKVRESKRQSFLAENDLAYGTEDSCNRGQSLWSKIRVSVFGGESDCQKLREHVLISPLEEISPLMVVSETASQFLLLPLQHFGANLGLFFRRFYEHIPLLWQPVATALLVFLVSLLVFAGFGYGIRFPFFLGGIGPVAPSASKDAATLEKMILESEERVRVQNEKLLHEAKAIMDSISKVAIAKVKNADPKSLVEPVVGNSASSISRKLDEIISETLISRAKRIFASSPALEYSINESLDALDGGKSDDEECYQNVISDRSENGCLESKSVIYTNLSDDDEDIVKNGFSDVEFLAKVESIMSNEE